jgi:translocation and assembly module TamA
LRPPAPERPVCPPEPPTGAPPPPANANLPEVEPIVCQDELTREVPPLGADDPALGSPLESVAEFEARLRAQEANNIGVAPSADPEPAQPLPPLSQFDVREVELAEAEPAEAVAELRYTTRVEGLTEADAATETALLGQFEELSALDDGGGKAANEAMLSARLTEDSKLLQRILQAEGWYDVAVQTRIDRSPAEDGQPVTAVLVVSPGERYKLGTIAVQADTTVPPDLINKNLALQVGEPIIAQRIQGAEANVAVVLPQEGYPFATVGQRDMLLDPETHLAIIPFRSRWGRGLGSAGSARPATSPSEQVMCAPCRGSSRASCTTAATSTTCARRWSRPGCSPRWRWSRSGPAGSIRTEPRR